MIVNLDTRRLKTLADNSLAGRFKAATGKLGGRSAYAFRPPG